MDNNYKLYTYELYPNGKIGPYLLIITKWTDKTSKATEEGHRKYYVEYNAEDIRRNLKSETFLKKIYSLPENTILKSLEDIF